MSIKLKLTIVLSLLAIVFSGMMVGSYLSMKSVNADMNSVVADSVMPLHELKIIADAYAVSIVDNAHKIRSGETAWSDGLAAVEAANQIISEQWNAYLATNLTDEEISLVGEAEVAMKLADDRLGVLSDILISQSQVQLELFVDSSLYPIIDPVSGIMSQLVDMQVQKAFKRQEHSQAEFDILLILGLVFVAVAVAALAYAAFVILRTVSWRLSQMQRALLNSLRVTTRFRYPRVSIATRLVE